MINFDWPLETAGKRGKRINAAQELANAARWDIITAAWQVRGNVRDTLLDWQMAEHRSALLDRQFTLQEHIVDRLQQRMAAGETSRPELVTAQIALHKTQLDQQDAHMKSSDAHARLAGVLGLSAAALAGVRMAEELATNLPPALTAPEARRVALTSRSDILSALANYAAAEDDLQLEIAKQYPDVHLSPGYQYNQGDNQWMLGLTVELPLLNQNQGPVAEAEARRQLAAAKFTALQAQVIGEIDQAVASYSQAQRQLGYGETLLAAEQEQQSATQAQLKAGAADQFDLLAAQLEQVSAALVQMDNTAQMQRARGALEDALQHPLDEFTQAALERLAAPPTEKESQR
jgi:cobalt-zinc-cadmium efflux system outer membrane protein